MALQKLVAPLDVLWSTGKDGKDRLSQLFQSEFKRRKNHCLDILVESLYITHSDFFYFPPDLRRQLRFDGFTDWEKIIKPVFIQAFESGNESQKIGFLQILDKFAGDSYVTLDKQKQIKESLSESWNEANAIVKTQIKHLTKANLITNDLFNFREFRELHGFQKNMVRYAIFECLNTDDEFKKQLDEFLQGFGEISLPEMIRISKAHQGLPNLPNQDLIVAEIRSKLKGMGQKYDSEKAQYIQEDFDDDY